VGLDGLADDVPHAHARTERTIGILKYHLDLAPVIHQLPVTQSDNVTSLKGDGASGGLLGSQNEL
jgi:hypothetical protein